MKHLICTECSRIIPTCNDSAKNEDLPCAIDGCNGFMEPIDEEMVPIIKMLNDKGYKTIYSCQGHFRRDGSNTFAKFSVPYIAFRPISILDNSIQFRFYKPCDIDSSPFELVMRAANKNQLKTLDLRDYMTLHYPWELHNEIQIGTIGPYVLHRSHAFYANPKFDMFKCEDCEIEEDLKTIRQSLYDAVAHDLNWRAHESQYVSSTFQDNLEYASYFISPNVDEYIKLLERENKKAE